MDNRLERRTASRREEILDACAALYETKSFRDITIQEIGQKTSFSRTSIYNYFQTKEEIFLGLLQREYEAWSQDLEQLCQGDALSPPSFPTLVAHTLEPRQTLLKLLCMNLYDMEQGSRLENLAAFKRAYGRSREALTHCLQKAFPHWTKQEEDAFLLGFYLFLFGVYPYTTVTEKQRAAMEQANLQPPRTTIFQLCRQILTKLVG